MPRHGFARDAVFETEKNTGTEATFLLRSNTEMLDCYPFPFELRLKYSLVEEVLSVTYEIANIGGDPMHFSVGGHPAFRVPLTSHTTYEDYYLRFPEDKVLLRWGLTPEGLIGTNTLAVELTDHKLALTRELFYTDALVMKHVKSKVVRLGSERHGHGLDFFREDFPYLGIWAAKNADFVCIEPWCGIADSAEHDQQLVSKEGIEHLLAGKKWSRNWRVKIF